MDKYTQFKRRVYLIIFPILMITNAIYWLFSPYVDRFLQIALPFFCLFFLIVWLLIYFKRWIRTIEFICLIIFSIYHLFRVYSMAVELEVSMSHVYALWSTSYYIFVFMVLERKQALIYALVIYLITILMGIPHIDHIKIGDTLIQYYLSTLIYILVMYFFQNIVSGYLESDILRKNAYYDALTDVGNRRLVDSWLETEVKNSKNSNDIFSIIYFDIDHFKQINDEYGHDVGDHVLKEFASLVKNTIQSHHLFGRWGGDEFVILLKDQTKQEAVELAETLKHTIEKHPFRYVGHITSSFGITSFQTYDTAHTLMKSADQALYMAKNSGRNNVKTL